VLQLIDQYYMFSSSGPLLTDAENNSFDILLYYLSVPI
jgi:hypothetical protein